MRKAVARALHFSAIRLQSLYCVYHQKVVAELSSCSWRGEERRPLSSFFFFLVFAIKPSCFSLLITHTHTHILYIINKNMFQNISRLPDWSLTSRCFCLSLFRSLVLGSPVHPFRHSLSSAIDLLVIYLCVFILYFSSNIHTGTASLKPASHHVQPLLAPPTRKFQFSSATIWANPLPNLIICSLSISTA